MARQYLNLYPAITEFSNLYLAWQKAARGKRTRLAAATFEMNLADELIKLQRELQKQTWTPGGYTSFRIFDPKPRLVSAAPFRDRVVHHALCNVVEPLFEQTFIYGSAMTFGFYPADGMNMPVNKQRKSDACLVPGLSTSGNNLTFSLNSALL